MADKSVISNRLKQLRKQKHITQKTLAEFLQVQLSTYREWESGKRYISTEFCIRLAEYFNVSIDYLLNRSNYETPIKNGIHEVTGLSSQRAAKSLQALTDEQKETLERLLFSGYMPDLLNEIYGFLNIGNDKRVFYNDKGQKKNFTSSVAVRNGRIDHIEKFRAENMFNIHNILLQISFIRQKKGQPQ